MNKRIEHKWISGVELKRCGYCKEWKSLDSFGKNKTNWDGLRNTCKKCRKQNERQYKKQYHIEHREEEKQYRIDNVKQINQRSKKWRANNVKQIKQKNKKYIKQPALYETYADQICWCEEVRQDGEFLEVKCAYCGRWIKPTTLQAKNRTRAVNKNGMGEARFYCSENCKSACPIYNQNKWPKGFKKATSREVVPLLRQIVLERDNYTCQKCGATSEEAQLHVHHEKSYTLNKIMANDPDNCLTLCKSCHKEIHKKPGCRYVDLQCPK